MASLLDLRARVSSEVERRLLEIGESDVPGRRHDVIYWALASFPDKSEAVVELLIESAESTDPTLSQRAIRGLTQGIKKEHHSRVPDLFVVLFTERDPTYPGRRRLSALMTFGNASHVEALEEFAANDLVSEDLREEARRTIERIRRR